MNYGERGVRTLGTLSSTHAFQACTFDHSDISPKKPKPEQRREGDSALVRISFRRYPAASPSLRSAEIRFRIPPSIKKGLHLAERGGFALRAASAPLEPRIRSAGSSGSNPPIKRFSNDCRPYKTSGIPMKNGERGIRTPGTLRFSGFRDRPIQPLSHLSSLETFASCQKRAAFTDSPYETKWVRTTGLQIRNLTLYPAEL